MTTKRFKRISFAAINSAIQNEQSYLDAIADTDIDRTSTVKLLKDLEALRDILRTHNIILVKA